MTQAAFKVDQLKVEPGLTGVRVMKAEPGTGKLQFFDPDALAGVTLAGISGVAVDQLFIVGLSGTGAKYKTIKDALAAARALRLAGSTDAYLILVFPGAYVETESLVVDFNDVVIQGFGGSVSLSIDDHVFQIKAYSSGAVTIWPERVCLSGLRLINASPTGKACVYIEGGDVSAVSSRVGLKGIVLDQICWETSVSGIALQAISANHVKVTGGSMKECAGGGSQVQIDTCASFVLEGVPDGSSCLLDLDSSHDIPEDGIANSVYRVTSSALSGLVSTLTGGGALDLLGCDGAFNVIFGGALRKAHVIGCRLGVVSVTGTVQMALDGTIYTSLSGVAGATLSEPIQAGFDVSIPVGDTAVSVTIPRQPDTNYMVGVSMRDQTPTTWKVTVKTVTSFTVVFTDVDIVNVRTFDWNLIRSVKNLV
jgi:hypothetical protein